MSQVGFTPIIIYHSNTGGVVPLPGNMAEGELAINIADRKIFTKTAGGLVVPLGGGATGGGTDAAFYENDQLITVNYTIGQSAMVSGITISIASPAVITMTNDFVADQPVRFTTTGALPTGIVSTVAYYVIAAGLSTSSFQISTTPGGAAVNTSGVQSGVHSAGKIKNAGSTGVISVASGITVTVPSGAFWTVS